MKNCTGIIVAGGNSSRMGGGSKQLMPLCGVPLLKWSLEAMAGAECIGELIVVVKAGEQEAVFTITKDISIPIKVVEGGENRQMSVLNGMKAADSRFPMVAIHDGARPLVMSEDVERVVKDAGVFGGATLGVPVKDTIKIVDDMLVEDTPPREKLYAVQTPQAFKKSVWQQGMEFALENNLLFTDDCQLVEAMPGIGKVAVTLGRYENIKVTTKEDLIIAEGLLKARQGQ